MKRVIIVSGDEEMDYGHPPTLKQIELPGLIKPLQIWTPPSVDQLLDSMDIDANDAEQKIPYWAEIWPSALSLAGCMIDGYIDPPTGRVLEIGSGLGLVGLVALKLGWDLTLSDRDPEACRWIVRNLKANGLDPTRVITLDWQKPPPRKYDCILAADILYERAFAPVLNKFFEAALKPDGFALIAEPGRPIARPTLELLKLSFKLREITPPSIPPGGTAAVRIIEIKKGR